MLGDPSIIISDRAFTDMVNETLQNIRTETGGVLLGVSTDQRWYVIESLDPGPKAILRSAYFEYDEGYMTHLANKVRLRYRAKLILLGLWHRHPGSFDRFSSTDDQTNATFARTCGGTAISGLVNVDPQFRTTFYVASGDPVTYRRASVQVGDQHVPEEYLRLWKADGLLQTFHDSLKGPPVRSSPALLGAPALGFVAPASTGTISDRGRLAKVIEAFKPWKRANKPIPDGFTPTIDRVALSQAEKDLAILDLIDEEIAYLEQQQDYSYELSLAQGGFRILLKRAVDIRECPPQLDFLFVTLDGQLCVCLGQRQYPYRPGITKTLVNSAMMNLGKEV